MALVIKNRVRETSTTTGTGPITLLGAVSDHRSFDSVMSIGDIAWVTVVHPGSGEWVTARATYSASNQITLTTVLDGSNGLSAVTFTAGIKDVFIDLPASLLGSTEAQLDASITTAKIADANVTNGKLAASAVSQDKVDSTVWTTGNGRLTLQTTAAAGWLMADDSTFGDGSSGAAHTGTQYQALFLLIYTLADADAPLLTSAGAGTTRGAQGSAATAWAAHCRMSLPKQLGRAIAIAGAGSGLTSRALGHAVGEETHTLTLAEAPTGQLTLNFNDPGHVNPISGKANISGGAAVSFAADAGGSTINTQPAFTGITVSLTDHAGGGTHNNMPPTSFWNVEIKL